MKRREFIAGVAAWSATSAVQAQSNRLPTIGFLGLSSAEGDGPTLIAFRRGLSEAGRTEGSNVRIESRHADGDASRINTLIADLSAVPVDVFLAPGQAVARALRRSTQTPIVAIGLPPVQSDPELFESLARPGGTLTGFASFGEEMSAKRIEFLKEIDPNVSIIGILHNATDSTFNAWGERSEASARAQGLKPRRIGLSSTSVAELRDRLRAFRADGGTALIVVRDFLTSTLRLEICRVALELGIAIIAEQREFADAGALFTYGANIPDLFRRAAGYVDRILKGDKVSELPIQLPTTFELVVNLRTAKLLRHEVPPLLLARADEVIE